MVTFQEIYDKYKDRIELPALNKLLSSMLQRIHNNGLDSSGSLIAASYSPSWAYMRKKKGLSINMVNLQYTDELFKDLRVGSSSGTSVIGVTLADSALKIANLELLYKKRIWKPTDDELNELTQAVIAEFDFVIDKYMDEFVKEVTGE